jgi:hypothetical protein
MKDNDSHDPVLFTRDFEGCTRLPNEGLFLSIWLNERPQSCGRIELSFLWTCIQATDTISPIVSQKNGHNEMHSHQRVAGSPQGMWGPF